MLNGVGRQAEGSETKAAEVAKSNQAIADKEDELKDARARLAMANIMADREMTGQRCGQRCSDWKQRAKEVGSHIAILEVQLNDLGAVKPVNAKAAKAGEIAAAFGFDCDKAKAALTLLEPTLVPFLLEWVAIAGLGFGFGHRPVLRTVLPVNLIVPATAPVTRDPVSSKGRRGRKPDPTVVDFVSRFREKHGRTPRGSEIKSGIPGIATSTAYDHAKRA